MPMRRLILLTALAALVVPSALAKSSYPPTIQLPNGFNPEGVAIGTGNTFYVGSIPTGAVYRGSLRTGQGSVLVPGVAGGSRGATGLEYDHGRLWVSGASTGKGFVYSARTGGLLREYAFATAPTFINDVVVTQTAAWFTDSQKPVLYRVAVSANGRPGAATTVNLSGDYQHVAGQFNLNGIDATASGKWLLAVQSVTGQLFRIDPATGATKLVDLGGRVLTNGDGILLQGQTLYVVQNRLNKIAVFRLSPSLLQGTFVREITDSDFDVPTTIGLFGKWLYAVNARFTTPPTPTTTYAVVQVKR
jgi:sugar lactone lactonase YvrE